MPSLSVQTAAQSDEVEQTTTIANENETLEEEDVDDSNFFEWNEDDNESDDEILDLIEDVQYLMTNQGQVPKWKDVNNAHENLVVHLDYAREKAFSLCKEETSFIKMQIEQRLNGISSTSFKNLMDIFFGPRSYMWKALLNAFDNENIRNPATPIIMTHESFMKHLGTYFIASSYHQVSTHHKMLETLLIILTEI
jgi:hypothetical protein